MKILICWESPSNGELGPAAGHQFYIIENLSEETLLWCAYDIQKKTIEKGLDTHRGIIFRSVIKLDE